MTDKDKQLIIEAEKMDCTDWYKIDLMEQQAETAEGALEIRRIANRKYHMEEYSIGNL